MTSCKVFVGNMSEDVRKVDLQTAFDKFGEVVSIYISSGYGFVTFSDPREASEAIRELDGKEFKGQTLKVEMSRGKTVQIVEQPRQQQRSLDSRGSRRNFGSRRGGSGARVDSSRGGMQERIGLRQRDEEVTAGHDRHLHSATTDDFDRRDHRQGFRGKARFPRPRSPPPTYEENGRREAEIRDSSFHPQEEATWREDRGGERDGYYDDDDRDHSGWRPSSPPPRLLPPPPSSPSPPPENARWNPPPLLDEEEYRRRSRSPIQREEGREMRRTRRSTSPRGSSSYDDRYPSQVFRGRRGGGYRGRGRGRGGGWSSSDQEQRREDNFYDRSSNGNNRQQHRGRYQYNR